MLSIRPLTVDDADRVEQLYGQSAAYLRSLGDPTDFQFDADVYRRDGFGRQPAFSGLGAVLDGTLAGYLLYSFGYDTDRALRYLFVLDLLVDETVRGQGIGKALMLEAASVCRKAGGAELFWVVYERNEDAKAFYRSLGGEDIVGFQLMHLGV